MRGLKITFGVMLLLVSVAVTAACYLQSQGAGISTGSLLAIVITAYAYDHRRHLFSRSKPDAIAGLSTGAKLAMHQGRLTALQQDGGLSHR